MIETSITFEHGAELAVRLQDLANAARVFGNSRAEVGTEDPVGRYVVEGTRPHVISPRDRDAGPKALYWPGARHPVRSVHHPGTTANPFMQRALDKAGPEIERLIVDRLEVTASGGGGNYTQIMESAGKVLLKYVQDEAPVRTGNLRQSLYMVDASFLSTA